MERTLISQLKEKVGQQVRLQGWVQTIRDQGGILFIVLRDITGLTQVVIGSKELLEAAKSLTLESVVEITGTAKSEAKAFTGIEVSAE